MMTEREKAMNPAHWWRLVKEAISGWSQDRATSMAAALAYYSIFSLAPLLLIVIWVAGLVFGADAARGAIFDQFEGTIGRPAAEALNGIVDAANKTEGGGWASLVGVVLLIVGASGAFLQLQDALDVIFRAEPDKSGGVRKLIRTRLLSFSLVVGCGFLLLVSLVVSAALSALHDFIQSWGIPGGAVIGHVLHLAVSLLVVTLLFAMIFKFLPDRELRWRDTWFGAFITAALFTLGKFLIGLYIAHGSVASAYGAAGTLVVLLVWVYYSALIVLFGAELTRAYSQHGTDQDDEQAAPAEAERSRIPVQAAR
jgi:membrane protein